MIEWLQTKANKVEGTCQFNQKKKKKRKNWREQMVINEAGGARGLRVPRTPLTSEEVGGWRSGGEAAGNSCVKQRNGQCPRRWRTQPSAADKIWNPAGNRRLRGFEWASNNHNGSSLHLLALSFYTYCLIEFSQFCEVDTTKDEESEMIILRSG